MASLCNINTFKGILQTLHNMSYTPKYCMDLDFLPKTISRSMGGSNSKFSPNWKVVTEKLGTIFVQRKDAKDAMSYTLRNERMTNCK